MISNLFYINLDILLLLAILIILTLFCGLIIIFWWRSIISNSYLEKLHERDIERYESELSDKQSEIDELKAQNAELSKIIHKDNKLIPAMNLAVREIIDSSADKSNLSEHAKSIISQLDELAKERKGIIHDYESNSRKLQRSGVASVDALLKYLFNRACKLNINFDIMLMCDIKYLTKNIISENDFNTIVADLGENAIIAVSKIHNPNVLISFCIEDEHYQINFYDNAPPFAPEVLSLFGKERITTHKESGGSGIGLMTLCELLKKYNASFEIDETIKFEGYTKRVSVCFDGKADFRTSTAAGSSVSSINQL
ncbi:MAG: GHKL domain-containing protein [Lachnospiraceae bacterium]|nr:GHKL domain-containing protein [Lachnospiraceae bacterium]